MKKSLVLLVLPALLLSGCNKEISAADAKAKAKEIEDHQVDVNSYESLGFTSEDSVEAKGTYAGEEMDSVRKSKTVNEFFANDKLMHTFTASEEKDNKKGQTVTEEDEAWYYLKDNDFYSVFRSIENGEESKTYSVVKGVGDLATKAYETSLQLFVKSFVAAATGKEGLEVVQKVADGQAPVDGANFEVKYYTSGDGNLTVEGKVKYENYEFFGFKANGEGTIKYGWDKYLLSMAESSNSLTSVDEANGVNIAATVKENVKVSYDVKASYPDLNGYQQILL